MHHLLEIASKPDNIPIVGLMFLLPFFLGWAFKQATENDKRGYPEKSLKKVQVWPYLCRSEFLALIVVSIILMIWTIVIDAPLEEPSDPTKTPNPSKAPWYFLGLQEMLVYFDPWIAGVLLPGFIIIGLMAIPYIDINPKGGGYYTWKERKFAITMFLFGFLILWVTLIIVGTFIRGPGWYFFKPWEPWDPHKVVSITNVNFPHLFGIGPANGTSVSAFIFGGAVVFGYYTLGPIYYIIRKKNSPTIQKLGLVRYIVVSFLFLTMMSLPIKMLLRWFFNVKYIWVTPWFNI